MADRSAHKAEARRLMAASRPSAFSASLLITGIAFAASIPYFLLTANGQENAITFFLDILSTLLGWVLTTGLLNFLLLLHRGRQPDYNDIWDCLGMASKVIWLQLRINVQIALWSCLFFFPGIVAAVRYSLAMLFLVDDPSISAGEALRRSCQATNGWKMELFLLELSFLPLMLLCLAPMAAVLGATEAGLVSEALSAPLMLALSAVPTAWLEVYLSLARIGYYRQIIGDQADEPKADTPWEI